jgi:alpha-mannosidase
MSTLQKAMKQSIFKDAIEHKVTSNETISSYSEQLKEFNEYTKNVSADPIKYDIVQRFHRVLPAIAAQKTQPDIFFDA